jgi:RNA polymerase sigma factor (sigma-70 family)
MDAVTADDDVVLPGSADVCAFAALFTEQFEPMRRLAYLLGADDPENVAQEAFVRLHLQWGRLRDHDKALPYLRATVANLSRMRLRHLRVARRKEPPAQLDAASAETQAMAAYRNSPVWTALGALTVRQRQVIVLRFWLDLPLADIAAILNVSVGTVKATLSQAAAKLRAALQAEENR